MIEVKVKVEIKAIAEIDIKFNFILDCFVVFTHHLNLNYFDLN
jgi:hypothetical protein